MNIVFIIGRVLLGGFFVFHGYGHFKNSIDLTAYAQSKGIRWPKAMVLFTGVILLLSGLTIVTGIAALLGMVALVIFLLVTTFVMHAFWKDTDPHTRSSNEINFGKNIALVGALLMLIAMAFAFL